ncbi:unnamed protein product [Prorocentrum cordatum]|uniref:Guanine nucleotide-binding protein subunit beta-like protein n=1 Tax=Prorocentrum cordatum TaxID=2364126 RepID=A0ABN9QJ97_9DINO|nr:unnamed protein product [Polarella glacialis]
MGSVLGKCCEFLGSATESTQQGPTADPTGPAADAAAIVADHAGISDPSEITWEVATKMKECLEDYPNIIQSDSSTLQEFVNVVADVLQGANLRISLAAPIELVCRAVANTAIKVTDGTDVGEVLSKAMQSQQNIIQRDVEALREMHLKSAMDEIEVLAAMTKTLMELKAEGSSKFENELTFYVQKAISAEGRARDAFNVAEGKLDEKVRATTLMASAMMAQTLDPKRESRVIADQLTHALKKLFNDEDMQVLIGQECGSWNKVLCFRERRQRRLREAFQCLVHVEGWIAQHAPGRQTVLSSLNKPFDMNRIAQHGILDPQGSTVGALARLAGGEEHSDMELSILQSYCGQRPKMQAATALSGSEDNTLKLWELSTGRCLRTLEGHTDEVMCVTAHGKDGALSGSQDKALKLWELSTGRCLRTGHTGWMNCVTAPGEDGALVGSEGNALKLWEPSTRRCLRTLTGHTAWAWCVTALGKDGALSGSSDKTLKLWELSTGRCLRTLEGHTDRVTCATALGEDGALSGSDDRALKLWELSTGRCLRTLTGHASAAMCVTALGEDGALSGSMDKTLKLWELSTGRCLRTLTGHAGAVICVTALGRALARDA